MGNTPPQLPSMRSASEHAHKIYIYIFIAGLGHTLHTDHYLWAFKNPDSPSPELSNGISFIITFYREQSPV